ncbi:hypothetical protein FACS1894172_07480 [Spirochaetia bacterium]|nr:hypothetical protein FACS1894164_02210 [Spirochaetia bacterium]GHU31863.1 hypothetical protein FACS1894172_07480 [Spirochaetia bacterium]
MLINKKEIIKGCICLIFIVVIFSIAFSHAVPSSLKLLLTVLMLAGIVVFHIRRNKHK